MVEGVVDEPWLGGLGVVRDEGHRLVDAVAQQRRPTGSAHHQHISAHDIMHDNVGLCVAIKA